MSDHQQSASMDAPQVTAMGVSPFELGKLVEGVSSMAARVERLEKSTLDRMERMEKQTAERMERFERNVDKQLTDFANTLKTIAEGYARREEVSDLQRDVENIAGIARQAIDKVNALEGQIAVITERNRPLSEAYGWILKALFALATLGAAAFVGHSVP